MSTAVYSRDMTRAVRMGLAVMKPECITSPVEDSVLIDESWITARDANGNVFTITVRLEEK